MRVAIVGCGIGGLATANFFSRLGHNVKVFDRVDRFIPTVGAGFSLSPNGQRVFNQLGYTQEVSQLLHPYKTISTRKPDGSLIGTADVSKIHNSSGYYISGCKRASIIQLLADKLPPGVVNHNKTFRSLGSPPSKSVILEFTDGEQYEADILIGADGIRSSVQKYVLGSSVTPRFTGYQIFYGTIHDTAAPNVASGLEALSSTFPANTVVQLIGGGRYFLTFNIGGEPNPSRCWAQIAKSTEKDLQEGWEFKAKKESLNGLVDIFIPEVRKLIELTPPEHIIHFGLYDRDPLTTWFKDRVVLLGDACHATLPNSGGQGANMALEDAFVLAQAVTKHGEDVEAAFKEYQKIRQKRTDDIVMAGQHIAKMEMLENPILCSVRNWLIGRMMRSSVFIKMMEDEILKKCPVPAQPVFNFVN